MACLISGDDGEYRFWLTLTETGTAQVGEGTANAIEEAAAGKASCQTPVVLQDLEEAVTCASVAQSVAATVSAALLVEHLHLICFDLLRRVLFVSYLELPNIEI